MELVRDGGKPYSKMIDLLLSDPIHDEDTEPEVLKNMTVTNYSARIGEKQSTVNIWLRQIYSVIIMNDSSTRWRKPRGFEGFLARSSNNAENRKKQNCPVRMRQEQ